MGIAFKDYLATFTAFYAARGNQRRAFMLSLVIPLMFAILFFALLFGRHRMDLFSHEIFADGSRPFDYALYFIASLSSFIWVFFLYVVFMLLPLKTQSEWQKVLTLSLLLAGMYGLISISDLWPGFGPNPG